mmetsp:Transcript_11642/g.41549  ORF Transcript_11642/g.41549 Transcript_11642/m.41549 type:complete len:317 (+) Transcript_11642:4226-5176(+)
MLAPRPVGARGRLHTPLAPACRSAARGAPHDAEDRHEGCPGRHPVRVPLLVGAPGLAPTETRLEALGRAVVGVLLAGLFVASLDRSLAVVPSCARGHPQPRADTSSALLAALCPRAEILADGTGGCGASENRPGQAPHPGLVGGRCEVEAVGQAGADEFCPAPSRSHCPGAFSQLGLVCQAAVVHQERDESGSITKATGGSGVRRAHVACAGVEEAQGPADRGDDAELQTNLWFPWLLREMGMAKQVEEPQETHPCDLRSRPHCLGLVPRLPLVDVVVGSEMQLSGYRAGCLRATPGQHGTWRRGRLAHVRPVVAI